MPSKFIPGDAADGRAGGLYTLTAGDVMTLDPVTVASDASISEVADILVRHKVGGLPVVDGGELKGIITQADVLRFLRAATGAMRDGALLAFRIEARPAPLADLLADMREMGLTFSNVITANDLENAGSRHVYVRLEAMGDRSVETVAERLGETYDVLYYVNEGITVDMS